MGRVRVSRSGFQYLFQKNHRKYYNMEKCVGIEKSGGCRDALHIIINFLRFSMPVLRTKGEIWLCKGFVLKAGINYG
jgi:hypothetical protein